MPAITGHMLGVHACHDELTPFASSILVQQADALVEHPRRGDFQRVLAVDFLAQDSFEHVRFCQLAERVPQAVVKHQPTHLVPPFNP